MRKLDLQERKEISFNILKEIDRVCKSHNINYFIAYGTLIGAVRHKGFIPWDDDIDIWVKWTDYKRLNGILASETEYEIINTEVDAQCPINFTKVSDRRTLVKKTDQSRGDYRRGVAVDIFPLCPYQSDLDYQKQLRRLLSINRLFSKCRSEYNAIRITYKGRLVRIVCKLMSAFGFDDMYWRSKLDQLIEVVEKPEQLFNPFSPYKFKDVHPAICFADSSLLMFEDRYFDCPVDYDLVLRDIYGDYMKMPPKEKQISNHDTVAYMLDEEDRKS